ncbi:MAG TPA: archease [Bacteroidota bacterium]|nr:archease [Bacteroidota bacterium]
MRAGYTILEHPSDLGIEARGRTLPELFQRAATALCSIIVELETVRVREQREVVITASDREQLFVRWLTEILYLYDGTGFVCKDFRVESLSSTNLKATVLGEALRPSIHSRLLDVKAVTYHQLSVRQHDEGWVARVFLDI